MRVDSSEHNRKTHQKGKKVAMALSASPASVEVPFGGAMPFRPPTRPVEAALIPRFLFKVVIGG